jgi:predicted O-methyltransferase YrrM
MIEKLLKEHIPFFKDNLVFVETGCGLSTIALNKYAKELNALAYSLDYNIEKCNDLKSRSGDQLDCIKFVIGDSLENLHEIVAKHTIDFLFLDSAASAMHTFREFLICEPALKPGACLLVDNASLPYEKRLLSPVRKGKIIVPYLLSSPYWEVFAHPIAGDSMISAILHREANFADPIYEHPEYIDNWRTHFDKGLQ